MLFLTSLLIAGVVAQNDCSDMVCPDVERHLCVEHVGTDVVMTVRNTCTLEFLRCMYGEENMVLVNEGDCQNGETTTVGLDLDTDDARLLSDDYYDGALCFQSKTTVLVKATADAIVDAVVMAS
ncbi:MAG: hypothetical protein MHM6MM_003748 [Cercozoa sp. M6MM]